MIDLSKYPTLEKIRDMAMDGDRANMERELADMRREAVTEAIGDLLGKYARQVIGDDPEDVANAKRILDAAVEAATASASGPPASQAKK